ncbi:MAG TPA: LysR family transcriptional regulator [Ruminiclostridium sp.]|nr:LysR family transcriptional regulator [Ruminiclostridium sp.]
MIDYRINTFLAICKTMNFTKASEILNITQPAVTKHIRSLEEYYKAPLFRHKGRSTELTEEGKILYEYAKKIEAQSLLVERRITNSLKIQKHYTIGATLTIGEYVLPSVLGRYKKLNSHIDVTMHVFNTEIISEMLINGEIDLGLVEGPFDMSKFCFEKFQDDELVFAVSPQNRFSERTEVRMEEILESKLILREDGSGTRKVLENKLLESGLKISSVRPFMEVGSIGAIKSLVELNLGCTIISKAAIQREIASGSIVVIPIKDIRILRTFNFIYLKESPKEFIDSFIEYAKK